MYSVWLQRVLFLGTSGQKAKERKVALVRTRDKPAVFCAFPPLTNDKKDRW